MCDLVNLDETVGEIRVSQEVTGWYIKAIPDEVRKDARAHWHRAAAEQPRIREGSSRDDIEREAE